MKKLKKIIKDYMITRKSRWTDDDKARLLTGLWFAAAIGIACVLDMGFGLTTVGMIVGCTMIFGPIAVVAVWFIISLIDGLLYDHYKKVIENEQRRQR